MTAPSVAHAAQSFPVPLPDDDTAVSADRLIRAGELLLQNLQRGTPVDAAALRQAMTEAFSGSDAQGKWRWKEAYEALEIAQVMFLRNYLPAMRAKAKSPAELLAMVQKLTALTPTHTKRSDESMQLQQFSTPPELCLAAAIAADVSASDLVLEPSAGTGLLASFAATLGASLHLNELGATRADILARLFPGSGHTRHNAENINDHLAADIVPSVVLMNPPFSASPNVSGTMRGADLRHVRSALLRLAPGGRLVAITSQNLSPHTPDFAAAFEDISRFATLRCSFPLMGSVYKRHGTTMPTRLSVLDRVPGALNLDGCRHDAEFSVPAVLELMPQYLPPRLPVALPKAPGRADAPAVTPAIGAIRRQHAVIRPQPAVEEAAEELAYTIVDAVPSITPVSDALYEPYEPEVIRIEGAQAHPTKLVQSTAMASVRPPKPTYRPHLPPRLVTSGILSAPQLESVIYAGEAHSRHLAGSWLVSDTLDTLNAAPEGSAGAVQFRRGFFIGDGTGAGKGRQVAGIIFDNWIKGRRRALWISKNDKLLEDAQRDWAALGQEKLLIIPQSRYPLGKQIPLAEGILFTTYATLRSAEREGKESRLQQITNWLGKDFDGVIVFDEGHAMANAAGSENERGTTEASQQGIAGLRLQHALPNARVVYVSATGATTVENLAYAQRLGLWGSDDLPFPNRGEFIAAMQMGGIASMEVLCRDLKALGLYMSRSLSYDGVEVHPLEHQLTPTQTAIYDQYADGFQIIHNNLEDALEASNITRDGTGTLNKNAKSAAKSAFYSNSQRFFGHLITAFKVPTLISSITADLADGKAVVIQLVSTSEALMERRLAQIPPEEWGDLSVDITPREYVLSYLQHSFPTQLYETYKDDKGKLQSRPAFDEDGNPIRSREAEQARDAMLEHLAALPPVQSALDQIVHHFGTDMVAEVTGRGRRIIKVDTDSGPKLMVQNRPGASNLYETQAFMDDEKRILIFSDAGGTGRSYHADLACKNQRPRVHYLLEPGWKADTAIQGLGRTNRTNQAHPPLFRPVATDVRGEKRFLSTICRRLHSLGAMTRGERETGGQGMFRATDNLESVYGFSALRQLFHHIINGHVACCSLLKFESSTGLDLCDEDGTERENMPRLSTFLNRVLALPIALQNGLFGHFENLLAANIESAIAGGTYEVGLETIRAESLVIESRRVVATHAASGATTEVFEISRKDRNTPVTLDAVKQWAMKEPAARLLYNKLSGRAALCMPSLSFTLEDGTVQKRVRIIRPMENHTIPRDALKDTWAPVDDVTFEALWNSEVRDVPEFKTSTFHMITGLLLPILKRLKHENPRVYRFETDQGERVIGRVIPPAELDIFAVAGERLTPDKAWQRMEGGAGVTLTETVRIKRSRVMQDVRYELIGFDASEIPHLKALGLMTEIIAWQTRLFIPTGEDGRPIIARLLAKYQPRISNAA